jgi:carboxypeptidase C (cathepsin A)
LDGFFYEHGPLHFANPHANTERAPDAVPELMLNPSRWSQIANIIYLEAPAGVGFSYATDGNYTTDDNTTAAYNFEAVQQFYLLYPEYSSNDFYISGESYGNVSLSCIALAIN